MYYPEGLSGAAICHMEGCVGSKGYCSRCGETNYQLLGYYGAVARWAKAWGVTEKEAERRIGEHAAAQTAAALRIAETGG